jgi:hypothetical protein
MSAALHDPGGKVRLAVAGDVVGDATFSACGRYRYRLERRLATAAPDARAILFVCMNPSTAEATVDDPTVRRCWTYSRDWGFARMLLCNVMAYRATHPDLLLALHDPMPAGVEPGGADNVRAVLHAAREAGEIVCAWGRVHRRLRPHVDRVEVALRAIGFPLSVLTLTKEGHPGHPLYLRRDLTPQPWKRSALRHG